MRTVLIKLPRSADFTTAMTKMRSWLDACASFPSKFTYDLHADAVIVQVEFDKDREAEFFKRGFDGMASNAVASGPPRLRETMEQVCRWRLTAEEIRAEADEFASEAARETMAQVTMSYDRMAEDLEKRLANPRYRDGLFVA
jgi:hypothetical protein